MIILKAGSKFVYQSYAGNGEDASSCTAQSWRFNIAKEPGKWDIILQQGSLHTLLSCPVWSDGWFQCRLHSHGMCLFPRGSHMFYRPRGRMVSHQDIKFCHITTPQRRCVGKRDEKRGQETALAEEQKKDAPKAWKMNFNLINYEADRAVPRFFLRYEAGIVRG